MVFTSMDGSYINPRELLRRFQSLLEKAGLEKKRFHNLGHTFASFLLNENENPKVIQELLGHANIITTMDIYSHVLDETKVKQLRNSHRGLTYKKQKSPISLKYVCSIFVHIPYVEINGIEGMRGV